MNCFLFACFQEECANFIRLIEPWNRTQLYVCGTGAYNPVCTFVNRGRKPQVGIGRLVFFISAYHGFIREGQSSASFFQLLLLCLYDAIPPSLC